jgi:hypothetical protein
MKRILFAAAAAALVAVLAGQANANGWGAPVPGLQPPQGQPQFGAPAGDRYGYHPALKRLMWWKVDRCPGPGCGGAAMGGGGTMVYPNHPYARSPRDWFQQ